MLVISSQIFRSRLGQRDVLLRPVPGVLRSSEFSPYHTWMIFVAKKQLFIKTNLLAAACHWANSSSSRPRRGVRSLSSCWSPVVSSRNVLVGFDCSDCKVPIPSCNEFLNISSYDRPGYDSRKFLDVSIMLNRCFSGFLPCDMNCIWSDMTLSQVSAGPINQNSACFPRNGIHEAEESWARERWQTETIRHKWYKNPRRVQLSFGQDSVLN